MKWFRIPKENSVQPKTGTYRDWKRQIATECFNQCVYCSIHENNFGGIRNFHVEHYKPKSKEEFKILENDIKNLYFACSICNCFKGSEWPNNPNKELNIRCYPDPSEYDYSDLFDISNEFKVKGKRKATEYMVNKLFLNRPQLIMERHESYLDMKLEEINIQLTKLQNDIAISGLSEKEKLYFFNKLLSFNSELITLILQRKTILSYSEDQIRR